MIGEKKYLKTKEVPHVTTVFPFSNLREVGEADRGDRHLLFIFDDEIFFPPSSLSLSLSLSLPFFVISFPSPLSYFHSFKESVIHLLLILYA